MRQITDHSGDPFFHLLHYFFPLIYLCYHKVKGQNTLHPVLAMAETPVTVQMSELPMLLCNKCWFLMKTRMGDFVEVYFGFQFPQEWLIIVGECREYNYGCRAWLPLARFSKWQSQRLPILTAFWWLFTHFVLLKYFLKKTLPLFILYLAPFYHALSKGRHGAPDFWDRNFTWGSDWQLILLL